MENVPWDSLPGMFPEFQNSDRWLHLLQGHADLLQQAQPRVRVTSVSPEQSVRRHYAESLEILRIIVEVEAGARNGLVDVGSGGGFPGLVAAAVFPEARVTLVEPLKKRAALLRDIATSLGLNHVTVLAERAEESGRGPLRETEMVVTARAVAKVPVLLEYCAPLLQTGGLVVLVRGSSVDDDVSSGRNAADTLGLKFESRKLMRPEISEHGSLALYRKVSPTPTLYPRRPGMAEKRPL